MKRIVFFFLMILLTACGQTTVSTPSPIPTSTPSPIPTSTPLPEPTEASAAQSTKEPSELLIEAINGNDLALVISSLEQGADLETKSRGSTALHLASFNGFTEIASYLIDAGADVNSINGGSFTPLMGAAQSGHADVISLLANSNIDLAQQSPKGFGETALHLAAENGHTEAVEALLDVGAGINVLQSTAHTPLMYAAYNGQLEVVEFLIDQGAELNLRGDSHGTAIDHANDQNHPEIAELIAAAGGTE